MASTEESEQNLQDKILTFQDSLLAFPELPPLEDPSPPVLVMLKLPAASVSQALAPDVLQIPVFFLSRNALFLISSS